MKHLTILLSATALAALFLTACCADDLAGSSSDTRPVTFTVTLTKGDAPTRSFLREEGGDLTCYWQASDKILVTTPDGSPLGLMGLQTDFTPATTAHFTGKLEGVPAGIESVNLFYLGNDININNVYNEKYKEVTRNFNSQTGTIEGLSKNDFFSVTTAVTCFGNEDDIQMSAENVKMERVNAFGRFNLTIDGTPLAENTAVTVTGSNLATTANIKFTNEITFGGLDTEIAAAVDANGDVWLTILPNDVDGSTATTLTFTTTVNKKTYVGTLDAIHQWEGGQYVRVSTLDDNYNDITSGVLVELTEKETDPSELNRYGEPKNNPLAKFAKGNLYRIDGLTNGVVGENKDDNLYENGALYQWGRNYGYMDNPGIWSEVEDEDDFINFEEAFGEYEIIDGVRKCDYYAYCDDGYWLSSMTHDIPTFDYDYAKWYSTLEELQTHPDKFFINASMSNKMISNLSGNLWMDEPKDYWLSSFGNGGTTWESRASACKYEVPNPCPDGYRLPSYDEFAAILPKNKTIYDKNRTLQQQLTVNGYSESRHEGGVDYAIRWKYDVKGSLQIDCLLTSSDFSDQDLSSIRWDSQQGVVTRIFPFTGGIATDIGYAGYDNVNFAFPYHVGIINFENQAYYGSRLWVGNNTNRMRGGYWVSDKCYAMVFVAGERTGSNQGMIELSEANAQWGYAIRPVLAE